MEKILVLTGNTSLELFGRFPDRPARIDESVGELELDEVVS